MRIFAKFSFICNVCFLISVAMRIWQRAQSDDSMFNGAVQLEPVFASVAVLGILAIFINLIFVVLFFFRYALHKMNHINRYILVFNLLILPFQIYYFFFSKF